MDARKRLLKDLRIGIAFEGGGAKGSFGWAVVEKLHEAGIEPVAVAGTSAGALSAIALAAGKYAEGSDLYRRLVLKDIFPFKLHWALGIPLLGLSYAAHATLRLARGMNPSHVEDESAWANRIPRINLTVLLMAAAFFFVVNYADPWVTQARPMRSGFFRFLFPIVTMTCWTMAIVGPPGKYLRIVIFSLTGMVMSLFVTAFPWRQFDGDSPLFAPLWEHLFWVVSLVCALVAMVAKHRHTTFNFARTTVLSLVGFAMFKLIFALPWKIIHGSAPPSWEMAMPYLLGFVPLLALAALYGLAIPLSKITLAGNDALRAHVETLARDGIALDCWVAVATARKLFDPDKPTVYTFNPSGAAGGAIHYPRYVPTYMPCYFNLKGMSPQEIGQLAVASAALPFGIVPASEYQGCDYVDGGMADNCPIRPLIDEAHCDLIITIHLRPNAPLSEIEKHYQATWRLTKLHEHRLHWSEGLEYNPDSTWWDSIFPLRDVTFPPHLPVMPEHDLGGLLSFRKAVVDRRIAEGHKQGQEWVDALLEHLGEPRVSEPSNTPSET